MKVSIITPSFNQGQFIEQTLLSVKNQTGGEIEHIVFDGGSTDQTVEVLTRFSSSVFWVSEKDRGQTAAINKGIRAAQGEIIGWLNSDDIYYPDTIEFVVNYFKKHPHIDVIYGMADHIDKQGVPYEAYPTEAWCFERLLQTCFICQPALFFRRKLVEEHGLLDETLHYCMDYEYWLRLGLVGVNFVYVEKKFAGSRMYKENKTMSAKVAVHREINDMLKKKFGVVPDRWIMIYAHAMIESKKKKLRAVRFIFFTMYGALFWNKKISTGMCKMMVDLVKKNIRNTLIFQKYFNQIIKIINKD